MFLKKLTNILIKYCCVSCNKNTMDSKRLLSNNQVMEAEDTSLYTIE